MRFAGFIFMLFLCVSFYTGTRPAKEYPKDYFQSPVGHTISLTGTFGELRNNHFHAGMDIRATDGKAGEPVYAAAEGFISRIKVQAGGYGNALYIDHPNGYTTVYAHLQEYTPLIEALIRKNQYAKESFELDLSFKPEELPVTKGQVIGKLGNSGSSEGPHLHFEIRDSKTENTINPLLFGFQVKDNLPPSMSVLRVYALNDKRETVHASTVYLQKYTQGYGIKGDTLVVDGWRCGFALKTHDTGNGLDNMNGVYSLSMYTDDSLVYEFKAQTFSFDETRYINAHVDYAERVTKKVFFNKAYLLPGNYLSMYDHVKNAGVIPLYRDKATFIRMVVKDVFGNSSQLKFWAKRADTLTTPKVKLYNYILPYQEENVVKTAGCYVYFPKKSLYENLYMNFQTVEENSSGMYSDAYHVHDRTFPVHRYFDIAIQPKQLPDSLRHKAFIAYCAVDHSISNFGGEWADDGFLRTKADILGDFCIMVDTVPPTIKTVSFAADMTKSESMKFKISDNFNAAGNAARLRYRAEIDGKWILMKYDAKNDLLMHIFDGTIAPGDHQLKLVVTDNRGNRTVLEKTFKR